MTAFERVFAGQFVREYGRAYFVFGMALGSLFSAAVAFFLVTEATGVSLAEGKVPGTVLFALLGGYLWACTSLIRGFAQNDVSPITYFWIVLRYVLAVCVGVISNSLVTTPEGGTYFVAFGVASLPFGAAMKVIKTQLGKLLPGSAITVAGHPPLQKIQGITDQTLEKLDELGLSTTAELAQRDPLALLFQTSLSPKTLIDLIDQAFLYNYVGDKIDDLRVRGIRGAIELASLHYEKPGSALLKAIATVLQIKEEELDNLIENVYQDNQVRLVWEIWGGFER